MFDEHSSDMRCLLGILDILFSILSFALAMWIQSDMPPLEAISSSPPIFILPLLLSLLIFFLSYFDAYHSPHSASNLFYTVSVVKAMTATLGLFFAFIFFLDITYINRLTLTFAGIILVGLITSRIIVTQYFHYAVQHGKYLFKVLIIGSGERALSLSRALTDKSEGSIDIVGYLDVEPELIGKSVYNGHVIGTVADIDSILKNNVIDEVIVAIPRTMLADVDEIAHACEDEGVKFRFMADIFNLAATRISLTKLAGVPLLTLEPVALDESKLLIKRIMDLSLTLIALPFSLPILAIIAICIKLDDGGPVIFIQERVGLKKRIFPMLKFRSMHVNAESMLKDIEHLNEADGPNFKISNDPRLTRVGRFLRRTSLDELPQLLNVLYGNMSLVGPRPMSIRDVKLFNKGIQRKRFSVKPGITCIWQISGRSNLSFNKWLELDLQYIDNWSLSLDLVLLLKTIPVVLFRNGAV